MKPGHLLPRSAADYTAADDTAVRAHPQRRTVGTVLAVAALVAGFGILVLLMYQAAMHATIPDSDAATALLQGQAMRTGNPMLNGWALSFDPFWTIDGVFYAVAELVDGMRPELLYLVPAAMAALVIVVAAALARDGRTGAGGVAAAVTVVALLALPSHALSLVFLHGAMHVGTVLWCLIAFAGLRSGRFGWGWSVAVVFLAAGVLGDFETVALGMAPALAVALIAIARTRDWRSGAAPATAAGAALLLAGLARWAAVHAGTYTISTSHPRATLAQMPGNLKYLASWDSEMLGVGSGSFGSGGMPTALQAVHVIGLLVVVAGVVSAAAALARGVARGNRSSSAAALARRVAQGDRASPAANAWLLDDLLLFAFLADVFLFVVLDVGDNPTYSRELTAGIIFGIILAGRLVGGLTAAIGPARLRPAGAIACLAVIPAFAAGFGLNLAAPKPARPYNQLASFLEDHHLRQGIGDYWSASITTAVTGGTVRVRPVVAQDGRIVRYNRQSAAGWYAGKSFEFLVFNRAQPWLGVDAATASATFGRPAHSYVVGAYQVLVWSHPIAVSPAGLAGFSGRGAAV